MKVEVQITYTLVLEAKDVPEAEQLADAAVSVYVIHPQTGERIDPELSAHELH